jgi:replicative DNA helicase
MPGINSKKLINKTQPLKVPPQSIEAEESVLGSILLKPEILSDIKEYIPSSDIFYYKTSQIIWDKMIDMEKDHLDIDIVTLRSKFNEEEKKLITAYYLTGLPENVPSTAMAQNYAKVVLEKFLQREIIDTTFKVQSSAYDNSKEFESLIKEMRDKTDELTALKPNLEPNLNQIINQTIESIETSGDYVKFGYEKLDNLAGGMTKGEVTVIAGRPGHGKTTFAVNLMKKFIEQDLRVLCINREMTNIEMMKKLIVLESGKLSYRDVRTNNLNEDSYEELVKINKKIVDKYTGKLFMCDTARDLAASTRQVTRHNPDVIIDDYIQLIKMEGYDQRRFELESVMNEYKWLAKTYHIVPILLSQLNRDIERRIDPIPKMSDLAESGSIEQVAENILFVYYDYKVNYEESELGKHKTQIVAAKVRYGENRKLTFGFNGDKVSFTDNLPDHQDDKMIIADSKEVKEMLTRINKFGLT